MKKYIIPVILLTVAFFMQALAQVVQFKIPITIQNGNYKETLWLGVSGDGPDGTMIDNTYGIDGGPEYGKLGEWTEMMYPPDCPDLEANAKFVDIPGRKEIGGTGIKPYDFRGFTSINQVDTFAIRVYGESVVNNPLVLSWPKNLKAHGHAWKLLKKEGRQFVTAVENMLTTTTYRDSKIGFAGQYNYLIVKTGVVPNEKKLKGK